MIWGYGIEEWFQVVTQYSCTGQALLTGSNFRLKEEL